MTRTVTIYASDLAACIGWNKFKPVSEVARTIWRKTDPEGYQKALFRNDTKDPEPIADTLENLQLIDKFNHLADTATPESLGQEIDNLTTENAEKMASKDIKLSDITSFVLTERGKKTENESLRRLERKLDVKINDRNNRFYRRTICCDKISGQFVKFTLGGKVDGITEDGRLVEVKNRQYKLFSDIPMYEKVQIHAYMFLTGMVNCIYVQSFKGEDVQHTVEFDQEFWDDIKFKCIAFVRSLEELIKDPTLQDALLSSGVFECTQ
jgi:hypothetical protein